MTTISAPPAYLVGPASPAHGPATFSVPARHNPRLQSLVDRIKADEELRQLWRCANVNAVERLGLSDHGETHIRIVANAGLRLLRLLVEAGQPASVVAHHGLAREDAEVVVVLAAALHDVGLVVHYERHHEFSLALAHEKARALLSGLYPVRERTILLAEVLHAIAAHLDDLACLTLEAGVLRVADALDLTKGRSRSPEPAAPGALAASAIEEVSLLRGEARPVRIEIRMSHPSGVLHADEVLRPRLQGSLLAGLVEVFARVESETERRLVPLIAA
jgi:metal-dependent HD superfamily phosphatase/phosphodiesterase